MTDTEDPSEEEKALPFVAPCRDLETSQPWDWLKHGWGDFKKAPKLSLTYGLIMTLITMVISIWAFKVGSVVMAIALMAGFVFLFPALAMGTYSISCQLEKGELPQLFHCLRQGRKHMGNAAIFAFCLLIVFLIWARASSAIHIFFPAQGGQSIGDLAGFLSMAGIIVLIFSSIVFCASALSLPMIMDRRVDAITAILTSFNAVLKNKKAMAVWLVIILTGVALGFATAWTGLVVILPVLGHATWHAYRETVIADEWPQRRDTVLPQA